MRDALRHHRTVGSAALPGCRARHPHLGWFDPAGCSETVRAMVLGASNQWFSLLARALYIPDLGSDLAILVDKHWARLAMVTSPEVLAYALQATPKLAELRDCDGSGVWAEITRRRAAEADVPVEPVDLTAREYEALVEPGQARPDRDFTAKVVPSPGAWRGLVATVVRVSRLRETGRVHPRRRAGVRCTTTCGTRLVPPAPAGSA